MKKGCFAYIFSLLVFSLIFLPVTSSAQDCGCMDVVLVVDDTGSMGGAINNVKAGLGDIVDAAQAASGGDLRMGLVSFWDTVQVDQPLTDDIAAVENAINALIAAGGANEPEASDQSVLYTATGGATCVDVGNALGAFRGECLKIAVLVTDARPGGCDDMYEAGIDDVNAHAAALAAYNGGVLVSAVLVPTFDAYLDTIRPIMQDYATTTNGVFTEVSSDGSGTGAAIEGIIATCGSPAVPVDIYPGKCPNYFYPQLLGNIPVAISSTESFDVTKVDPATVKLAGVSPVVWGYKDVATPFEPFTGKDNCSMCTKAGSDGLKDLFLKFDAKTVWKSLGAPGNGECVVANLTGNLKAEFGGTAIVGEDVVSVVIKNTPKCDHALCVTGGPLASACDPCVAKVCAEDPFCCTVGWDTQCVNEAVAWCGISCPK